MSDFYGVFNFKQKQIIQYLENRDYNILDKNFKSEEGDIDIIATKKDKIVFGKLKMINNFKSGKPVGEKITEEESKMYNLAEFYLYKNNLINVFKSIECLEFSVDDGRVNEKLIGK